MDGNGRWARKRHMPRTIGHRKGVDTVRRTIEACGDLGIEYLTLFSFSSENWTRPQDEIGELMRLLRYYLSSDVADLHRRNIRLRVIGERDRLSSEIVALIENAERLTSENTAMNLTIALSYGARQEIASAARRLAEQVADGTLRPEEVDEDRLSACLFTADLPEPDLLIRTSGEKRVSNFLLWQLAYAEFVFADVLWPDFQKEDLIAAISEFHRRDRRYGAVAGSS
ncbi:MAG: isoprenyl transferase [Pseudomonadota bacterium]